ncbi:hypothetical protein AVI53_12165 [Piscirickettsia salmonis]|nr:hypothetical protein PSLF89_03985 [Piscirickettsia salmonis LF-89 = ATCC VR-1361]ALY01832.1 hypothetical protein AWE47_02235 [Piscirickettsia salmonis]AMA41341.1 hypothetical protein AWJ11_02220 [Piscirickettsia salmonis]AOS36542.1 hypothetical protein AVM72_15210 [Piscirickettsia salmonis]APS61224.1 hypothetical protein AVI53_12165 [Piscirickettsia salmonis]
MFLLDSVDGLLAVSTGPLYIAWVCILRLKYMHQCVGSDWHAYGGTCFEKKNVQGVIMIKNNVDVLGVFL